MPLSLEQRTQTEVRCECGCGEFTLLAPRTSSDKGWIKGEPQRWIGDHKRRVWQTHKVDSETGCWVWQGTKTKEGYGRVLRGGRAISAHRWYWEEIHGQIAWTPSGDGLELDHLCRNPSCVNPDHLELVSRRENMLRGENAIAVNARRTHCKRGHPLEGDNLLIGTSANGRPHRRCRACYEASPSRQGKSGLGPYVLAP